MSTALSCFISGSQNDAAGEIWQKDICAIANAVVKRVQIPRQYKDLNAWTQAGALSGELRAAISNADTLKLVERSCSDALNEGVVTARELRELELQPPETFERLVLRG
jgi:hypothetical protein